MAVKRTTFAEFKIAHEGRGDSVMQLAYFAQLLSDDKELQEAGAAAIAAEDKFHELLHDRGFNRG